MMTNNRKNNQAATHAITSPTQAVFYELEVEGVSAGFFTDCSNIGITYEVLEIRDPSDFTQKTPGRRNANDIILKRLYVGDPDIWTWRRDIQQGYNAWKNCVLNVWDETTALVAQFLIERAWPSGLVTEAGDDGNLFEVLTITSEVIRRQS